MSKKFLENAECLTLLTSDQAPLAFLTSSGLFHRLSQNLICNQKLDGVTYAYTIPLVSPVFLVSTPAATSFKPLRHSSPSLHSPSLSFFLAFSYFCPFPPSPFHDLKIFLPPPSKNPQQFCKINLTFLLPKILWEVFRDFAYLSMRELPSWVTTYLALQRWHQTLTTSWKVNGRSLYKSNPGPWPKLKRTTLSLSSGINNRLFYLMIPSVQNIEEEESIHVENRRWKGFLIGVIFLVVIVP